MDHQQLRKTYLFEHGSSEELKELSKGFTRRTVTPGSFLFKEGDRSQSLYFIEIRTLKLFRSGKRGLTDVLVVTPGSLLGEFGFLDDFKRSADAMALEALTVCELPFDTLSKFLEKNSSFSSRLYQRLGRLLMGKLRQIPEDHNE